MRRPGNRSGWLGHRVPANGGTGMTEREIIDQWIKQKEKDIDWFGSANKQERERQTVAAYLKCLGIPFEQSELLSVATNFPDVCFRDAHFEIKEIPDFGRKRHGKLKEDLKILKKAKKLQELAGLIEPYNSINLTMAGVADKIQPVLAKLAIKYPADQRNATDLLIYFNLRSVSVSDSLRGVLHNPISAGGWRSVSVVGNSWSFVFHASPRAPAFIRGGNLIRCRECWG